MKKITASAKLVIIYTKSQFLGLFSISSPPHWYGRTSLAKTTKEIPRDGIWLPKEMLVRVITCSDHSSAAWKQMTWCSEIKVFSHCIRLFSLVGGQEARSAFGRHLLFRLYLTTSVSELGMHLCHINPASIALQAHRFPPVSTQPPVFLRGY